LSEWMYDTPIKKREKKYFDYFKNMFWIDNLIGDFVGSLYGAKPMSYVSWNRGIKRKPRQFYDIWASISNTQPSFVPTKKSDYMVSAKEAMKYSWKDKFRF
jgi:hypothetical protein